MKLVNLQMAGLNEQQGYVLKLTSAEGYKEERVEVGLERKNFFVLSGINSVLEFLGLLQFGFQIRFSQLQHSHCLLHFQHPVCTS